MEKAKNITEVKPLLVHVILNCTGFSYEQIYDISQRVLKNRVDDKVLESMAFRKLISSILEVLVDEGIFSIFDGLYKNISSKDDNVEKAIEVTDAKIKGCRIKTNNI